MSTHHHHRSRISWPHVIQSCLHVLQITISYMLMLTAMTFNLWYFMSVVIGAGIGYFCFGARGGRKSDSERAQLTEHCH